MKVQHFVLTRFNVASERHARVTDKQNRPVLTDEWMAKRFDLFEKYCLPSMMGQTSQEFIWLVYFDAATDAKYKQRINELFAGRANFLVRYRAKDAHTSSLEQVQGDIRALLPEDAEWLLTTRLDNDDALHRTALARLQQEVVQRNARDSATFARLGRDIDGIALNMRHGCCLQVEPFYALTHRRHGANPFISMLENVNQGKLKSVWAMQHGAFEGAARYPVWQINDRRYWVQIVHNTNLLNDMVSRPSNFVAELTEYGIDTTPIHIPMTRFGLTYMGWLMGLPVRVLRSRIRGLVRKLA